jgi:uncharacterized protein
MAQTAIATKSKPVWVDLATSDAAGSRRFYEGLFGWNVEVNPDPQYGGYGLAKQGGKDVAGIGPAQTPGQPTAWSFYVGTDDLADLSRRVENAGGKVIAPAFDVGDQGQMAVFQDPTGAFISGWKSTQMGGFQTDGANAFGWAELNARGVGNAIPFYEQIFGWTTRTSPVPGGPDYNEFQVDGESVAGATELSPEAPAGMPSYWLVYFNVDDVDGAFKKAIGLGATELVGPQDFPGGRFAIVSDPQGGIFGLMKTAPQN